MYTLSIAIDESSGAPSSIWAKEVEWNETTEEWDLKSGGETFEATSGSLLSWDSDLRWYHMNIDTSGFYSVFYNGSTAMEGYEGKRIEAGDLAASIALNSAHRAVTSGNPHSVTKSDISLGNVSNYAPADQVSNGITKAHVTSTGLDISDLADASGNLISVADVLSGIVGTTSNAKTIRRYLASELASSVGFAKLFAEVFEIKNGTSSPSSSVTPDRIGDFYVDTSVPKLYVSNGLTNTSWFAVN